MDLVLYLSFDGTCEEAFKHYERVLKGKILAMMRTSDMPTEVQLDPGSENRIMHARLEVNGRLLMGGDAPPGREHKPQGFCAHIKVEDPGEAERIFRELGAGGTVTMPLGEAFWARRFGMLTDRFNVPWMVNCEKPMGQPETSGKPFVISRTFDVPKDKLWRCFATEEGMKSWWGPKGVTIIRQSMDFRPGGMFHYGMRTPDGNTMWGRAVYREIVDGERIVYINAFSDEHKGLTRHPLAPTWPIEMHTVFAFTEPEPGKSTFTVTWMPLYATPEEQAAFDAGHDSMTQGWTGTLDRLSAHLAI